MKYSKVWVSLLFHKKTPRMKNNSVSEKQVKISVITATYNVASTITDCLVSLHEQKYSNYEHIIVDGCSTDNTLNIINSMPDHRRSVICGPDSGIYDALNKGIRHSTGEVVCFLHADDVYTNNQILMKVAEVFKDQRMHAVYGDLIYVRRNNIGQVSRRWKSGKFQAKKLARGWMPPHPTLFVRRELFHHIGVFDLSYPISADYHFIFRLFSLQGLKVRYIPEVLVTMRSGGVSNRGIRNILDKSFQDYRVLRDLGNSRAKSAFAVLLKNTQKLNQLALFRRILRAFGKYESR